MHSLENAMPCSEAEESDRQLQTVDIGTYEGRLQILEILASAYEVPRGLPDPMAGDGIQTQWQLVSGRAPIAWWDKVNYCLIVWRFLALQSRGEFQEYDLRGAKQVALPDSVRRLLFRYYDGVRAIERDRISTGLLQALFWTVHAHTVTLAMRSAREDIPSLPSGEKVFALGWGDVMVRIVAGANFSTGQDSMGPINATFLPQRICRPADLEPEMPSDLPDGQRATVVAIAALYHERSWNFLYTPLLQAVAAAINFVMIAETSIVRTIRRFR